MPKFFLTLDLEFFTDFWPDPKDSHYYCLRLFVGPIRRIAIIIACVCLLARSEGLPLLLPAFVCLCVCVCACLSVCLSVVHPPSAQVLQSILIKLGHMDHWGT